MPDWVDDHVTRWSEELRGLDPVQEEIFTRLAILHRHMTQARRDTLHTGGLTYWQFKVLLTLRRQGPPYSASPSHLADGLGLTRGALSAQLGPLEQDDLITRATDGADRRRVHVQLTPAGHAAFEQHINSEGHSETALLATLTSEQKQALADLLRQLTATIG